MREIKTSTQISDFTVARKRQNYIEIYKLMTGIQ